MSFSSLETYRFKAFTFIIIFFYYPSLFLVKTPNLSFLYSCKKITTFSQFQEESQPLLPLESLTTVEGLMHVILLSVD